MNTLITNHGNFAVFINGTVNFLSSNGRTLLKVDAAENWGWMWDEAPELKDTKDHRYSFSDDILIIQGVPWYVVDGRLERFSQDVKARLKMKKVFSQITGNDDYATLPMPNRGGLRFFRFPGDRRGGGRR